MTFTMLVKFFLKFAEIVLHFTIMIQFAPAVMGLNLIVRYLSYFHTFIYLQLVKPVAQRRAETSHPDIWLANAKNIVCSSGHPRALRHPDLDGPLHPGLLLPLFR